MAGSVGFGYNQSDSSSTGRQGSEVQFPKQFVLDLHNTLGGPLTINDLFKLAPRPRSLFGYGPTRQLEEPNGPFNLGFGPPTLGSAPASGAPHAGTPTTPAPPTSPTPQAPAPAPTQTPVASTAPAPRRYNLADIEGAYFNDPDKEMDIPRLFAKANLDPSGFTYDQLAAAIGKAKKYGFSGRSRKNFTKILAGLQRDDELQDEFAGGKGTGIF